MFMKEIKNERQRGDRIKKNCTSVVIPEACRRWPFSQKKNKKKPTTTNHLCSRLPACIRGAGEG